MTEVTTSISKGKIKRALAMFLALVMCVTAFELGSFAPVTAATTAATSANATTANATSATATNCKIITKKTKYVYTGKVIKAGVKAVKDANGKTIPKKYYSVSYKNNKKVGTATVKVTFNKKFTKKVQKKYKLTGVKTNKKTKVKTLTGTFQIIPKATAITKVKAGKKSAKVTYKKAAKAYATGYQIKLSTSKKFTKKTTKTVTVKGVSKNVKTVKKLKAKKKYFVKVRVYKTVKGKKYYSNWSKVKTVKTK